MAKNFRTRLMYSESVTIEHMNSVLDMFTLDAKQSEHIKNTSNIVWRSSTSIIIRKIKEM